MVGVADDGAAAYGAGNFPGLKLCAKSGTAEVGDGTSHAWFTGFSNVDDPDIVVTVIVEGAGSGGEYAVPIAKRIFDSYYGL